MGLGLLRRQHEGQRNNNTGTLVHLTRYMNSAIQALHQALHNGHAQARARYLRHTKATIPFKGRINLLQKLFTHTAARILYNKAKIGSIILVLLSAHHKGNLAPGRSVLNSVGQHIIQNLMQTLQIAIHIHRLQLQLLSKVLLLQLRLSIKHIPDFLRHHRHIKGFLQVLHSAII